MKKTRFFNSYRLIQMICNLFVLCSLLLFACQEPYLTENIPPQLYIPDGKGSVTLVVDGADARTISPNPNNITIAVYTIKFLAPGTSTVLETEDRLAANISDPFHLIPGTYDIQVIAYLDTEKTKAAAQGQIDGLNVVEGTNVTRSVSLKMHVTPYSKGTFRWEITVPAGLSSASMKITPVDSVTGTAEQTIPFTGQSPFIDSRSLNTGFYQITFELSKTGTQNIIFREFLHVFDNLESFFSKEFTDDHFNNIKYTVTFDFDNEITGKLTQDLLHGEKADNNTPAVNKSTPAGLYLGTPPDNCTFTGWFNGGNTWNFETPVIGDMTLTAHWTASGLVDTNTVPANDIAAAINYVNPRTDAYTLLLDENENFSTLTTLTNTAKLTITGIKAVTINISGSFNVTNTASLTIGKNITSSGSGTIFIDTNASLTLSDNAVINLLNLNAANNGNSSVTIMPGWSGSVASLDLRGNDTNINNVIGFWYNATSPRTVLKGGGLNAATVAKFTLRNFNTSGVTSQPITAGYEISTDSDIGKLVAFNPEVQIGSKKYRTLTAAITDAADGTADNPTEIIILRDITATSRYSWGSYNKPAKHIKLTVLPGQKITITAAVGEFELFNINYCSLTMGPTPDGGTLTLNGNNEDAIYRRGVSIGTDGSLTMNKGVKITGFKSQNIGIGVLVAGSGTFFTMNGGEISGNTASGTGDDSYGKGGGGVCVSLGGTFIMNGGEISGNTASGTGSIDGGGGVFVKEGTFTMNGDAKIINNTSYGNGGGVYVTNSRYSSGYNASFTMNGGEISGNTVNNTTGRGGGVYLNKENYNHTITFTMSGGKIFGIDDPEKTNIVNGSATPKGVALYNNGGAAANYSGAAYGTAAITTTDNTLPQLPKPSITSPATGIELVLIPAGTFMMGSPGTEAGGNGSETQHSVTLTKNFYMGKYEVTQEQYQAVMSVEEDRTTTTYGKGDNYPVYYVSSYDAIVFCNKLSRGEGLDPVYSINGSTDPADWIAGNGGTIPTGSNATWNAAVMDKSKKGYRLPTEAEWEYACRAVTTTAYNTGDTISDDTGWYSSNSESKTHEVGKKPANDWGLYDMHGNLSEWCWDWYGSYSTSSQTDPDGALSGSLRVLRGGNWGDSDLNLRSAYRDYNNPNYRYSRIGFRVVRPSE